MMLPNQPAPADLTGLIRLRKELIAEGLSDNNIAYLVKTGALRRIRRGAYVLGERWRDLSPEDHHRLLGRAILRTAHPETVLTHTSSIVERGVPVWGLPLDVAHTTRAEAERAGRRARDWTPHRAVLAPSDIEEINGVRISRAARSALELTTIAGVEASLIAVDGLLHSGAMTLADFASEIQACRFWPRTLTANLVLHLADGRHESVGESRFSYFIHQQSLPRPEPQVVIRDEYGHEFARVDFAWVVQGVFVEFDGRIKYERFRRAGESLEDFLKREKRREEKICQLTGWTCIRVTWADLETPELLAARIRKILGSRHPVAG